MKRIIQFIIFFLIVAYSGFASFEWRAEKEKIDTIREYVISLSDHPVLEIAETGSMLESLLELNTSDEVLKERIRQCSVNARTLVYSSLILYKATGDGKYRLLSTAMANLENFFISANNRADPKIVLRENLDIIKSIGRELEKKRITDLTREEIERIFELSAGLEY